MNSTSINYMNIQHALRRYNTMVALDHGIGRRTVNYRLLPAAAWQIIAERLLTAMHTGSNPWMTRDGMQFVRDRANDAVWRSKSLSCGLVCYTDMP